ncbi:MAG: riboflavin synthase, partial [Pseudomonadota bacterium]
MFTGIINHLGIIKNIQNQGDRLFEIRIENFTSDLAIGASVACSGVCLTVISKTSDNFSVQVSNETLDRTTLANWQPGKKINLERALKLGDELGGHLVSGHVDTVGELK